MLLAMLVCRQILSRSRYTAFAIYVPQDLGMLQKDKRVLQEHYKVDQSPTSQEIKPYDSVLETSRILVRLDRCSFDQWKADMRTHDSPAAER